MVPNRIYDSQNQQYMSQAGSIQSSVPIQKKEQFSITIKYLFICGTAVLFSWLLHEFAHWCAGEVLGNNMAMTLNTSYPESGNYVANSHEILVSAAGPIATLIQAFVVYTLFKRSSTNFLFPFLLTCLYMRVLAGALNTINLNDEGRISKALNIGTYTLSVIVVSILFYLTYKAVKWNRIKTKTVVITTVLIMLFSSIIILADQALKLKVL